jgi:signal transduction histidine kinase
MRHVHRSSLGSILISRRPPRLGLAASLGVSALATAGAAAMELGAPALTERSPFAFFFLAVLLSSWLGGPLAGSLAIAVSVLANALFVARTGGNPFSPPDLALTGMFILVATAIHLALVTLRARWREQERILGDARGRRDELTAAVLSRDEFLTVAGHELNTPLAALRLQLEGLARLVRRRTPGLEALVDERLEKSIGHVSRLEALVAQLLDVSRLSTERLELAPEPLDFAEVVGEVVERLATPAARVGSPIRLEHDGPLPGSFDRLRLEQVAANLLSNAVKYGMGHPVEVDLRREGDAARLSVRDRGIGIEHGHEARIFERFGRAVPVRHYGGLGLGLWVVRRIVEAGGGTVQVESAPGAGATFTVRLPLTACTPEARS